MVTYKTLEVYLEKCREGLGQINSKIAEVTQEIDSLAQYRTELREQAFTVLGQINTLTELMDVESNPPIVEVPIAGDKIEELHDKRLEGPEGLSRDEVKKTRQDVYKFEAEQAVEQIDAANRSELAAWEISEGDS